MGAARRGPGSRGGDALMPILLSTQNGAQRYNVPFGPGSRAQQRVRSLGALVLRHRILWPVISSGLGRLGSMMPADVAAAQAMLSSGNGSLEQLAAANAVFYGWYNAQAATQQAAPAAPAPSYVAPSSAIAPAGCFPVGGGLCNTAAYGQQPCAMIRECDNSAFSNSIHYEYAGGNSPNASSVQVDPGTGQVVGYNNSAGQAAGCANSPIACGTTIESRGVTVYSPTPTGGGNSTAFATPSVPPGGTSVGTQAPATGGGGQVSSQTASATRTLLQNVSRPGQTFQAGDAWSLTITGDPNSLIKISATQNGQSLGTTAFGSTDANGRRVLTGLMDQSNVGSWVEIVTVGAGAPSTLNFSVVAPGGGSTGPTGGGGGTATDSVDTSVPATLPAASSFPWGLAAAAAVAALFLFGGKH
jgi:hypothetical protein